MIFLALGIEGGLGGYISGIELSALCFLAFLYFPASAQPMSFAFGEIHFQVDNSIRYIGYLDQTYDY